MTPVFKSATEAVNQFTEPVRAALEDRIRDARDTVEDRVARMRIQVRRHPFMALGAVAGAAAALGCVIGFAAGRGCRRSQ